MKKIQVNNKGITLVALVITIIVLLILAGVAINLAMDSNGLFAKANEAVTKWNASVAEEDRIMQNILEQMNEINGETIPEVTPEVTLSATSGEVEEESTLVITASLNVTATENIVWTSQDNSIATVVGSGANNTTGTITGVSAGTTTITATYGNKTATCSVTVTPKEQKVISFIIDESWTGLADHAGVFYAIEGWTWSKWCSESEYNTAGYYIEDNKVHYGSSGENGLNWGYTDTNVLASDLIVDGGEYYYMLTLEPDETVPDIEF